MLVCVAGKWPLRGRSGFVCWNITRVSLWLLCNVNFVQRTQRTLLQKRPTLLGKNNCSSEEYRCTQPKPFVGNLKQCVLLKTTIGEQLQRMYNEHSDKPYAGIFSFDKPGCWSVTGAGEEYSCQGFSEFHGSHNFVWRDGWPSDL
jgi:hypothetical protein